MRRSPPRARSRCCFNAWRAKCRIQPSPAAARRRESPAPGGVPLGHGSSTPNTWPPSSSPISTLDGTPVQAAGQSVELSSHPSAAAERRRKASPKRERARSKAALAGVRWTRVSDGDREDLARRRGDSPCRTAACATGPDGQTRWLFWCVVQGSQGRPAVERDEGLCSQAGVWFARCARSDCRTRAAAW